MRSPNAQVWQDFKSLLDQVNRGPSVTKSTYLSPLTTTLFNIGSITKIALVPGSSALSYLHIDLYAYSVLLEIQILINSACHLRSGEPCKHIYRQGAV